MGRLTDQRRMSASTNEQAGLSMEGRRAQFARGLAVQLKVLGALIMRELHTRYGRENVGYLWMFGEPMLLASAVSVLHMAQTSHFASDIQPLPFAMMGYSMFIMLRGMINRAEGTLESNQPLLYHKTVTIFDMMFARALLEGSSTFMTFVILLCFGCMIGVAHLPARPLDLLIGVGLIFWISSSLSFIVCAVTHDNTIVARFVHPTTYILMPLSGAFYQMDWIPEPYRSYMTWFPFPLIFEQLRYGMFYSATDEYTGNLYVAGICLVLTYIGLVSMKATRRHVHLR